jgi:tetratricopeptide (TPR) repeat protein
MRALLLVALVAVTACAGNGARPAHPGQAAAELPLITGLGPHRRPITTRAPEAQRYFDQGLAFLYAFNHDEAIAAFGKAEALDPTCAICAWGVAVACGPHINFPAVPEPRAKLAVAALARAKELLEQISPVERALIEAQAQRFVWPRPEDRKPLDEAYAAAMRRVWQAFPDDADVGALFAEALMDLRPWDLWTERGEPQPGTGEVLATLEGVMKMAPRHPLASHLYIHAVEASPHPEKADAAADRLRELAPALGHLLHMPSHIDVRRGRWEAAIAANQRAVAADQAYGARRPQQGFYRLYMLHDQHMLTFAAMMTGQSELALSTIREMVKNMPPGWTREFANIADGYVGMPYEVLLRFGRWDEILAEPEPPAHLPIARALRRYARGVARAARGDTAAARSEEIAFLAALEAVSPEVIFGNNPGRAILAVAEAVLDGEILVREGKTAAGIARLREAVAREDQLRYDEPPDWIQPVRHALGAALLVARRPAEAEAVYLEDLARQPENVWSLQGLGRALRLQDKAAEAAEIEARLARAAARADVKLTTSCFCLPGV